jgi:hypothetical protein
MIQYVQLETQMDAVLNLLKETFRPQIIRPGDAIDEVMFRAGQQSVIAWLESKCKPK